MTLNSLFTLMERPGLSPWQELYVGLVAAAYIWSMTDLSSIETNK
jgi:hypothetical protein